MDALTMLETLICERIGLDAASIGHGAIENALQIRRIATGKKSLEDYHLLLRSDPPEFDNLIEELVIPETWFFRDDEVFAQLLEICRQRMIKGRITRILSLPCSTGEEIYSVAIHLHSHDIPSGAYQLVGSDISTTALEHARLGMYRDNAFRCKKAEWLKTCYFTKHDKYYRLDETIRDMVGFDNANILDASSLDSMGRFDIILCRNLLIYFNRHSKELALQNIARLLEDDGIVFFGHAEGAAIEENLLYRSPDHGISAFSRHDTRKLLRKKITICKPQRSSKPVTQKPFLNRPEPARQNRNKKNTGLNDARDLADAGKYEQALDICRNCLEKNDTDADAYHVLGLIHEAMGNQSLAMKYFKKALYLSPDDIDTLIHLALLHELDGDEQTATRYRQRVERIRQRSTTS